MMQKPPQFRSPSSRRSNRPWGRYSSPPPGERDARRIQAAKDERDNSTPAANPTPQQKSLSPREVQVLNLIAAGKTHAAIASELGVREHTVLTHIRNLRVKLGAKNKLDAVLTGIRSGIVTE